MLTYFRVRSRRLADVSFSNTESTARATLSATESQGINE